MVVFSIIPPHALNPCDIAYKIHTYYPTALVFELARHKLSHGRGSINQPGNQDGVSLKHLPREADSLRFTAILATTSDSAAKPQHVQCR